MELISVINQKGGVGKTTTVANLGHALARQGRKVTLLDMDPQSHLTVSFGMNPMQSTGIDAVLLDAATPESVAIAVKENLQLVPAGNRLASVEHITEGGADRGRLLARSLDGQFTDQDVVIMDCPPSAGLLVMNCLIAGDTVLTPVVGDFLALQGLSVLVRTLRRMEQSLEREIPFNICVTRFHPRRRLAREVLEKLLEHFPAQVLATPVRESTSLAECPSVGETIFDYRPGSYGAQDYTALANDLLGHNTMNNPALRSA